MATGTNTKWEGRWDQLIDEAGVEAVPVGRDLGG